MLGRTGTIAAADGRLDDEEAAGVEELGEVFGVDDARADAIGGAV